MIQAGEKAPDFEKPVHNGESVRLSQYQGQKAVVLYFYPKDDTPGCTIEANQFTERAAEFAALDTVVIGVSKDSCESHLAFIDKYGLKVDLLADTDGSLCESYGVWQEKEKNGVKKMGIVRSTFLIDKSGMLRKVEYGVTAEGHAQEMLYYVAKL